MIPAVAPAPKDSLRSYCPADVSNATPAPALNERVAKASLSPAASSATPNFAAPDVAQILDFEPKLDASGAYIGEAVSSNGEKFFVKMEKLDAYGAARWQEYRTWTRTIAGDSRSVLKGIAASMRVEFKNGHFYVLKDLPPEIWAKRVGMTDSEFEEFSTNFERYLIGEQALQELQGQGLHKTRRWSALGGVDLGLAGMGCVEGRYVVYATKKPDFSVAKLPALAEGAGLSLKAYLARYDGLIMSVPSIVSEKYFENRGILKHPGSIMAGSHKRISMTVHAFSGAVARKFFPWLEALRVSPVGSQLREIVSSLRPDEYTINGKRCEITNPAEIPFDQSDWNCDVKILVETLDRYYREHPQRQKERQKI